MVWDIVLVPCLSLGRANAKPPFFLDVWRTPGSLYGIEVESKVIFSIISWSDWPDDGLRETGSIK